MAAPAVGLIFTPELMPLLRDAGELISVVEVDPQFHWQRDESAESVRLDLESISSVLKLGKRRTMHSAVAPVGGSVSTSPAQMRALRESVRLLRPEWMSEHLNFNRFPASTGSTFTGFLLPPLQTPAGVAVASHNLQALQREMKIPVAFETGVNYLKPVRDEMPDGDFFAAVARASGCGIVLDLHNLWVNEMNDRQSVGDIIACLPAGLVWEIHVAGGPPEIMSMLETCIGSFPNLQTVVFEIHPGCIGRVGISAIRQQLAATTRLCNACHPNGGRPISLSPEPIHLTGCDLTEVEEWERSLAVAIREGRPEVSRFAEYESAQLNFERSVGIVRAG